jgi:Gram-negative bacterial TonB protein C-terminal/Tetratrico peptide repeat
VITVRKLSLSIPAALFALMLWPAAARGQESVQMAQTLYASASYDEALAVLERLQQAKPPTADVVVINRQRALCLLALGRSQEAERAITAVVQSDPTYRADDASISPRVRATFRDVRTRLLPGLVQAEYAEARRAYDAKSWELALARFQRVVALAVDPDLGQSQIAALADLKMLADGFAKLSAAAAAPPAPPPPEPAVPAQPVAPAVDYNTVYDGTEPGVIAPVTLRQDLPRWTSTSLPVPRSTGTLEVIITKEGVIERATLTQPIAAFFDRQVLESTKNWRYRPATLNGQPVRFKKSIKISFQ